MRVCERLLTRTVVGIPIVTIVPVDVELTIVIAVHVHRIAIGIERPVLYDAIHYFLQGAPRKNFCRRDRPRLRIYARASYRQFLNFGKLPSLEIQIPRDQLHNHSKYKSTLAKLQGYKK